jgi:hypothetical protein
MWWHASMVPATQEAYVGGSQPEAPIWAKIWDTIWKIKTKSLVGGEGEVAHIVEHRPRKLKAQNSNPRTSKNERETEKRKWHKEKEWKKWQYCGL